MKLFKYRVVEFASPICTWYQVQQYVTILGFKISTGYYEYDFCHAGHMVPYTYKTEAEAQEVANWLANPTKTVKKFL